MSKTPYVVEIVESYHKTVIVYAENSADAESKAEALCADGTIEMERSDYADRTIASDVVATDADLRAFRAYE